MVQSESLFDLFSAHCIYQRQDTLLSCMSTLQCSSISPSSCAEYLCIHWVSVNVEMPIIVLKHFLSCFVHFYLSADAVLCFYCARSIHFALIYVFRHCRHSECLQTIEVIQ